MSKNIESVGFMGFGPMGQLVADQMMPAGVEKLAFDPRLQAEVRKGNIGDEINGASLSSIGKVANCDVVVFAVPAKSLEAAVFTAVDNSRRLTSEVNSVDDQLLVDVSSVKVFPETVFKRSGMIDEEKVMLTHPLFGPQSTTEGVAEKDMIVTGDNSDSFSSELRNLWTGMGLKIVEMSSDDHDKEMANLQALPFSIGCAFNHMGLNSDELQQFHPNVLRPLAEIADIDSNHTFALTETMLGFNPHATELIGSFFRALKKLNQESSVPDNHLTVAIGKVAKAMFVMDAKFRTPSFDNLWRLVEASEMSKEFHANKFTHNDILTRFVVAFKHVIDQCKGSIEAVERSQSMASSQGWDMS